MTVPVARMVMTRTSSSSPQPMTQPAVGAGGVGRGGAGDGGGGVPGGRSRSATVRPAGGGRSRAGSAGSRPSRRSRTWKWTAPRAWYSAALPWLRKAPVPAVPREPAGRGCPGGGRAVQVTFDGLLGAPP